MTRSSAAMLLNKTQQYPLGFDHKYQDVHMPPHERDHCEAHKTYHFITGCDMKTGLVSVGFEIFLTPAHSLHPNTVH